MNLPELFCAKNTVLKLRKKINIVVNESSVVLEPGTLFQVKNIVGYGFDLISLDTNRYKIRVINSDMPLYFNNP
ncbi:MAG: hypothetical protein ROO73_00990 [Roseivirga sp.]